jgi:hypothetical protein
MATRPWAFSAALHRSNKSNRYSPAGSAIDTEKDMESVDHD